jgi:hypothetical protein
LAEARAMAPEAATALVVVKRMAIAPAEKRTVIALRVRAGRPAVRVAAVLQADRVRVMARRGAVHRTMRAASGPEAGRARQDRGTAAMRDPIQAVPVAVHALRRATGRAAADRQDGLNALNARSLGRQGRLAVRQSRCGIRRRPLPWRKGLRQAAELS